MSSIDQRVVEMKFTNKQFESGVSSTMSMLDKLKAALRFDGAKKSIADLSSATKGFNLNSIGEAVDKIASKFNLLSVTGTTAIATIASKAVGFGMNIYGQMVQPLVAGFSEYEQKIGSIQTIMANTARHDTSLATVNAELEKLNAYSDDTIYNFADMTKNAALFTNAGIKIEDATSMIKGFSNAAAASGTSAGGAAGAAYQLTQAMNAGVIRLMDWRSLTNAGMGSKNMQEGLIQVAGAMGQFNSETTDAQTATKDFNGSLEKQWLSADVMTNYLKIMSGEMTNAEMAALGLSSVEIESLREAAVNAEEAARKVRTFSHLIGTLKEATGSGWAKSIELLVGDFESATELFSTVSDTLGGIIKRQADARNKQIKEFVDAGGREDIISGLGNLFTALKSIIEPVTKAFREIFPPKTGAELRKFSLGFLKLTEVIKMGAEVFGKVLGVAVKFVLAPIKALMIILGGLARGLFAVVKVIAGFAMGIAFVIGVIAKAVAAFGKWLTQTETAQRIFKTLKDIWDSVVGTIENFSDRIMAFAGHLSKAFTAIQQGAKATALEAFTRALTAFGVSSDKARAIAEHLRRILENLFNAWLNFKDGFSDQAILGLAHAFGLMGIDADRASNLAQRLVNGLRNLRSMARGLKDLTIDKFANGLERIAGHFKSLRGLSQFKPSINTGELKAATVQTERFKEVWERVKKVGTSVKDFFDRIFGGISDGVGGAIDKIMAYLKTLTFKEFLALLNTGLFMTLYVMVMRFINNFGKLSKGFEGIGDTFKNTMGQIGDAIESFGKRNDETIADKILKIAIALGILAAAVWVLSSIDTQGLIKALAAIAVMLVELALMLKIMSKMEFGEDTKIIKASIAIALMAVAILILSKAVRNFEGISWADLAKGLIGTAALLVSLAIFTKIADLSGSSSIKTAVSLIILSVAIWALSKSVEKLGSMDIGVLQQGLLVLAALMIALAGMTKVMNGAKLMSAAIGLALLSLSLFALSYSLKYYASLDMDMIVDGLQKIALVIAGIGVSARLLPSNLPVTAIGLALVAGAVLLLVPALEKLGTLPIPVIVQGLITLAVALGVIAAAMWVMSAPGTLLGAAALVVVVGALYLLIPVILALGSMPWEVVALGLGAIAAAFLIFAAAGYLLTPVIPTLLLFAAVLAAMGLAVVLVGAGMALFGIGFAAMASAIVAGSAVILAFLQGLIMLLPIFAEQLGLAIVAFAVVIRDAGPVLATAIATVIIAILLELQNIFPVLIQTFIILVQQLIIAAETLFPQIVAAALRMLLGFLQEMRTYLPQIVDEGLKLMTELLAAVADNIGPIVDEATRLMVEFMDGIERNIPQLVDSGARMVKTFIREVGAELLAGVPDLIAKAKEMASGIISGLTSGISNGATAIKDAAVGAARSAFDSAMSWLGIKSPSRKFMYIGQYSSLGMAVGLAKYAPAVEKAAEGVGHDAIFAMKKAIGRIPELIDGDMSLNPVITPVLDLSEVRKNATKLDPLLQTTPIVPSETYSGAVSANIGYQRNIASSDELAKQAQEQAASIVFQQTNVSPKALDRAEIYRQTNNQLSLLREEFRAAPRRG